MVAIRAEKTVKYVPQSLKGLSINPRLPGASIRQLILLERVSVPLEKESDNDCCLNWDEGLVICPGRLALCCYAKYGFSRRLNAPDVGGQLSVQKQERQQFEVRERK